MNRSHTVGETSGTNMGEFADLIVGHSGLKENMRPVDVVLGEPEWVIDMSLFRKVHDLVDVSQCREEVDEIGIAFNSLSRESFDDRKF